MLEGKGPSGSDRFNILDYQAFYIHFRPAVMYPQEVLAGFEKFTWYSDFLPLPSTGILDMMSELELCLVLLDNFNSFVVLY